MPSFQLVISNGHTTRMLVEARSAHEAVNDGVNAMARFACRNFPPPDNLSIDVFDENDIRIATVSFSFKINWNAARPH